MQSDPDPRAENQRGLTPLDPSRGEIGLSVDGAGQRVWCSVSGNETADRKKKEALLLEEALALCDAAPIDLEIADVAIADAERLDEETGELVPFLRITLADKSGKVYSTGSRYVRQGLVRLVAIHGLPTWSPPLAVTVKFAEKRGRGYPPLIVVPRARKEK